MGSEVLGQLYDSFQAYDISPYRFESNRALTISSIYMIHNVGQGKSLSAGSKFGGTEERAVLIHMCELYRVINSWDPKEFAEEAEAG